MTLVAAGFDHSREASIGEIMKSEFFSQPIRFV
jgi:hypothetical protein